MRLHAIDPSSRANGPGRRYTLWFQGCSLGCPGCYNPATHAGAAPLELSIDEIVADITARAADIDGVSISGGEPLEQPEALRELVSSLRRQTHLSILVFSGFRRAEIERMHVGPAVLESVDVLVDGRYLDKQRLGVGLRGSKNQVIHVLSSRLTRQAVEATPPAEVKITPSGEVIFSGVDPLTLE